MGDTARYYTYTHCPEFCLWTDRAARRRERIATAVLAGAMGDPSVRCEDEHDARRCAVWAVMMADAMIAVLDAEDAG